MVWLEDVLRDRCRNSIFGAIGGAWSDVQTRDYATSPVRSSEDFGDDRAVSTFDGLPSQ